MQDQKRRDSDVVMHRNAIPIQQQQIQTSQSSQHPQQQQGQGQVQERDERQGGERRGEGRFVVSVNGQKSDLLEDNQLQRQTPGDKADDMPKGLEEVYYKNIDENEENQSQEIVAKGLGQYPETTRTAKEPTRSSSIGSGNGNAGSEGHSSDNESDKTVPSQERPPGEALESAGEPAIQSSPSEESDESVEIDENMVMNAQWADLIPETSKTKERKFYVDLFSWMERERSDLLPTKLPSLGFHPVDFYSMYQVVTKYGGYEHFNNTHGWSLVHRKMKNYRPTMTSASYRIKKYYRDFLLDYEKAHFTPPSEAPRLKEEDMEESMDLGAPVSGSRRPPGRPPKTYKKRKGSITKERKRSSDARTRGVKKHKRVHRAPTCFQTIELNLYYGDPDVFGVTGRNHAIGPLYGDLFDMATGKALARSLPVKARVTSFGKLFYFELPNSVLPEDEDSSNLDPEIFDLVSEQKNFSKNTLKKGEIAFWADQNTFICGYGETPASRHAGEVRLIDFCVSCGRLWDFSLNDLEASDVQHDLWVTVMPTNRTRYDVLKELGKEHLLTEQPSPSILEESDQSLTESDSMEEDDLDLHGNLEEEAAESLIRFEHEPVLRPSKRPRRKKARVTSLQQPQQQQSGYPYHIGPSPTSPYGQIPSSTETLATSALAALSRKHPTLLLRYRYDTDSDSDSRLFKLDFNDVNDPLVREFQVQNNRFIVKPSNILRCLQMDEVNLEELVEIRYFEEHPENPTANGWILMRESFQASMPVTDTNAQILQLRLRRGQPSTVPSRYSSMYKGPVVHSSQA